MSNDDTPKAPAQPVAAQLNKKDVVAPEVADVEIERFAEAFDLDIDVSQMDAEDANTFRLAKRTMVRSITAGALAFNENAEPVFTPQGPNAGDPITFTEPRGADLMAIDRKKAGQDIARSFVVMGVMTKKPAVYFANMDNRDIKVCSAIVAVFLG